MPLAPIKNILRFSHNKWDKHLISSKKDLSQVPMFVSHNGTFNKAVSVSEYTAQTITKQKIQKFNKLSAEPNNNELVNKSVLHSIKTAQLYENIHTFTGYWTLLIGGPVYKCWKYALEMHCYHHTCHYRSVVFSIIFNFIHPNWKYVFNLYQVGQ